MHHFLALPPPQAAPVRCIILLHMSYDFSDGKGWDSCAATYAAWGLGALWSGSSATIMFSYPNIGGHGQNDARWACSSASGKRYAIGSSDVHAPGAGTAPSHVSSSSMCLRIGLPHGLPGSRTCTRSSWDRRLRGIRIRHVIRSVSQQQGFATHRLGDCDDELRLLPSRVPRGADGQYVPHESRDASHTPSAASDVCTDCHDRTLPEIHGGIYNTQTDCASCHAVHPAANAACDTCHASTTVWSKTADCVGCHPDRFDGGALRRRTTTRPRTRPLRSPRRTRASAPTAAYLRVHGSVRTATVPLWRTRIVPRRRAADRSPAPSATPTPRWAPRPS